MTATFDRQLFVAAQDPVFEQVRAELRAGGKTSHWMWFVFPQLRGLGSSAMAERYALAGLDQARAYLADPVLGPRLRDCTDLVLAAPGPGIDDILGPPDDLKFRSSMTLFALADPADDRFRRALERFFDGQPDPRTLALLAA